MNCGFSIDVRACVCLWVFTRLHVNDTCLRRNNTTTKITDGKAIDWSFRRVYQFHFEPNMIGSIRLPLTLTFSLIIRRILFVFFPHFDLFPFFFSFSPSLSLSLLLFLCLSLKLVSTFHFYIFIRQTVRLSSSPPSSSSSLFTLVEFRILNNFIGRQQMLKIHSTPPKP